MKCTGHGSKEPGGNSEYFGKLTMGMFNGSGKSLRTLNCFNRSDKKLLDLAINQTHDLNKKLTLKIGANDIRNGYATLYGKLQEKDLVAVPAGSVSKFDDSAKIYFRDALHQRVSKRLTFRNKYGDTIIVHYKLERI